MASFAPRIKPYETSVAFVIQQVNGTLQLCTWLIVQGVGPGRFCMRRSASDNPSRETALLSGEMRVQIDAGRQRCRPSPARPPIKRELLSNGSAKRPFIKESSGDMFI